jgi:hypothetical protein
MHNVIPYAFTLHYSTENSYLFQSTRDHPHGTRTFWYVPSNSRSTFLYSLRILYLVHLYNLNAYSSLYFNYINVSNTICQYNNIQFPSCTQLFYIQLSTFCYFTFPAMHMMLVICKNKLINFYAILFDTSSLIVIPCGQKHVGMLNVVK